MFAVGVLVHLISINWRRLTPGLLAAILVAGVLVGFCEEVLFRGILLRSLRNGTRAEAWCVLWSSVIFGLFHLSNVIYGAPFVNTLGQVGLAATSGAILYLFRRGAGRLAAGMVAHGVWDMSLFLPGGGGGVFGAIASVALLGIMPALGVAVLIVSLVRDRRLVVTQSGVETANVD
jgi:membrane protease YdiL (CAAX protease family)